MTIIQTVHEVLDTFWPRAAGRQVSPLGNAGGFSGSRLWRVSTTGGEFCLRRWPRESPDHERLAWIHAVLRHAAGHGLHFIPAPRENLSGQTIVRRQDFLWELSPWLSGVADYHSSPTQSKLEHALQGLARFHLAAASFEAQTNAALLQASPQRAVPPGIRERFAFVQQLLAGGYDRMEQALVRCQWPEFVARATRVLHLFRQHAPTAARQLSAVAHTPVSLQPCIRDIWHDHILFTGDELTGLVDFGAMRRDNVATDLARLLGSLVRDDPAGWTTGLDAYERLRPLSADERQLVVAYDRSTVLLSGMNWLQWICVEQRVFDDGARVLQRLDETLLRLEHRNLRNFPV